jgi:hypothetical protein
VQLFLGLIDALEAPLAKRRDGDATNVVLSSVGHNLRLVLAWLRFLVHLILNFLLGTTRRPHRAQIGFLTDGDKPREPS